MVLCFPLHLYGVLMNLLLELLKTVFNFMIRGKNGRHIFVKKDPFQFVKYWHNITVVPILLIMQYAHFYKGEINLIQVNNFVYRFIKEFKRKLCIVMVMYYTRSMYARFVFYAKNVPITEVAQPKNLLRRFRICQHNFK